MNEVEQNQETTDGQAVRRTVDALVMRYRRRRSANVLLYNPWNFKAEPGDLMVTNGGTLFRLEESSGWGKRMSGVLYPRQIKPPQKGMVAVIKDDEVYWTHNANLHRTKMAGDNVEDSP